MSSFASIAFRELVARVPTAPCAPGSARVEVGYWKAAQEQSYFSRG